MTAIPVPGFPLFTHDSEVMSGNACIRGMGLTVSMIHGKLVAGTTVDELLKYCPYFELEQVIEALRLGAPLQATEH